MADDDRFRIAYYYGRRPKVATLYYGSYSLERAIKNADDILDIAEINRVQIWPIEKDESISSFKARIEEDDDGGC